MRNKIIINTYTDSDDEDFPMGKKSNSIDHYDPSESSCNIEVFGYKNKCGLVEVAFDDLSRSFRTKEYSDFDKLEILREKITTRVAEFLNREIIDLRVVPIIIAECEAEVFGD